MAQTIIVVPCYNEATRLDVRKFRDFTRETPHHRFLFVNDGSTDGTLEELVELSRLDPSCFSVCDLPQNVGKAEAVRQGLLLAFDAKPAYVGFCDADLATPLDSMRTFRTVLDSRPGIDIVYGARVRLLGRSVERSPLRHYLGRVFATATSLTLGLSFYDTQCGAKLFRVSDEIFSLFREPFVSRWIFDVEILARLIAARRGTNLPSIDEVVYEFPLHEWRDVPGSKVRPRDFVRAFFELVAIYRRYGRSEGPTSKSRDALIFDSDDSPVSPVTDSRSGVR